MNQDTESDTIPIKHSPQDMIKEKMLYCFGVDLRELGISDRKIVEICESFIAELKQSRNKK